MPIQRKQPNKHGGQRQNSGRQRKSATLGPPIRVGGLQQFGFTRNDNTTENSIVGPPLEARTFANVGAAPLQQHQQPANMDTPNNNVNDQQPDTGTSHPAAPPAWMVEHHNAQLDPIDVMPIRNHNRSKRYNPSGLLLQARKSVNADGYQARSIRQLKLGNLWDRPTEILHHDRSVKIKDSWRAFFKYPIFNWLPNEMIPGDWKPRCGSCFKDDQMVRNGKSNPPRLIYGERENYLLNAPQKYYCGRCARISKEEKQVGTCRKFRTKFTWLDTDSKILEQLAVENGDIFEMFPCYLSHRAGLDKDLFKSIVSSATKGIGPGSFSDILERNHHAKWQSKEKKWAFFVNRRIEQPLLYLEDSQLLNREDIVKCPKYTSNEIGGIIPSPSWLVHMFCTIVESMRPYLDSECIKRLKTTRTIAIDASYKVPKWMMSWGGASLFDALQSGVNEYGELVLQHFATSDNHRQMRPVLELLESYGLDPELAFTDNPGRDKNLFESIFPSLGKGVEPDGDDTQIDAGEQPILQLSRGTYQYLDNATNARAALRLLQEKLDLESERNKKVISLDVEWPVVENAKGKISVIQLASPVIDDVLVIHIGRIDSPRQVLVDIKAILGRTDLAVVGRMVKNDIKKFNNDYQNEAVTVAHAIDVGVMAINRGVVKSGLGTTTLAALCSTALGYSLPKPVDIRVGRRLGREKLDAAAILYCARDAEAGLLLYLHLIDMPDLTTRLLPEAIEKNSPVELMPRAPKATKPVARGHVIQTVGRFDSVAITKNRFVVHVTHVYEGDDVVEFPVASHGRRCRCGRTSHLGELFPECNLVSLNHFGEPPFNLVVNCARLRKPIDPVVPVAMDHIGDENPESTTTPSPGSTNVEQPPSNDTQEHDEASVTSTVTKDSTCADDEDNDLGNDDDNDGDLGLSQEQQELLRSLVDEVENEDQDEGMEFVGERLVVVENDCEVDEAFTQGQIAKVGDSLEDEIKRIIAHADAFACRDLQAENSMEEVMWRYCQPKCVTRVLGDIFHLMDRVKVPMHHDAKAAFFRALRAAFFLMDEEDLKRVKDVCEKKGWKMSDMLAFKFSYIALRVKRTVPSRRMLYWRVKLVFEQFQNLLDGKTRLPLMNDKQKKNAKNVLEAIKRGEYSDPPGAELYLQKTDRDGKPMFDKDNLPLYRCIRGTNKTEGLHQKLVMFFGHTRAGPRYSDSLLALVRHVYSWRASEKNRPGFPQVKHYDGRSLDTINELYEKIYGYPKYTCWLHINDVKLKESPYGIVPLCTRRQETCEHNLGQEVIPVEGMTKSLTYLAKCQKSRVPFTPVRYRQERQLFGHLIRRELQNGAPMSAMATFENIASEWAPHALGVNKINNKYVEHLLSYYKGWQKNQDRKQAINAAKCEIIFEALEYTPEGLNITNVMHPQPLRLPSGTNSLEYGTEAVDVDENQGGFQEATNNLGEQQVLLANPQTIPQLQLQPQHTQQQPPTGQTFPNNDQILPPSPQTIIPRQSHVPQQPHSLLGQFAPQWVGPGMGLHHQRPLVLFGPQRRVPQMKRTCQHIVPHWPTHDHRSTYTNPCTPSPSNQDKRKKRRTCQVPGCSKPDTCPGSHRKHLCTNFKQGVS